MSQTLKLILWSVAMMSTALASVWFRPELDPEVQVRASVPLESLFPGTVGAWHLDPAAVAPIRPAFDVARRFQMYDQVLERTYVNAKGERIMLSVAYGRQQSVGLQMHRPEVCYRAGGFGIQAIHDVKMPILRGEVPVTRLFAHMDGRPEPITYWRLLGEDVMDGASDFKLQTRIWSGGALMDGLLVRVSNIEPSPQAGWRTHEQFIAELAQSMTPGQRHRVFGRLF